MLRVATVHAKPGMTLAMPVLHPKRPDTILLNGGVRLEEAHIRRLREIETRELWIRYPRLQAVGQFVSEDVQRAWGEITAAIADAFEVVGKDTSARLDYMSYKRAVQGLIEKLAGRPKCALFMQEMVEGDRPMLRHASNVAFISVLIGLRLDFYLLHERPKVHPARARDVSNLGVGAMLHDLGMLRLPRPAATLPDGRPDEDDPVWRQHPRLGYELVKGSLEASAAAAILCHHQRFDGLGFPNRRDAMGEEVLVRGRDIHVFARIVAAADLFDRLRHPEMHKPAAPGATGRAGEAGKAEAERSVPVVEVLRRMQEPELAARLDPIVLQGLLAVCPPYAPGTRVRLSDGSGGVVLDFHGEDPCRPTVAIVPDALAEACDEEASTRELTLDDVVDMRVAPTLEIVEHDGVSVEGSNFFPTAKRKYGLAQVERAIIERMRSRPVAA